MGRGRQKTVFDYDFNAFGAFWGPERGGGAFCYEQQGFLPPGLPWVSVSGLQENLNVGRGRQKAVFDYDFNSFGALWSPERGGALVVVQIVVFWHWGSPGFPFRFYNKKRALL